MTEKKEIFKCSIDDKKPHKKDMKNIIFPPQDNVFITENPKNYCESFPIDINENLGVDTFHIGKKIIKNLTTAGHGRSHIDGFDTFHIGNKIFKIGFEHKML